MHRTINMLLLTACVVATWGCSCGARRRVAATGLDATADAMPISDASSDAHDGSFVDGGAVDASSDSADASAGTGGTSGSGGDSGACETGFGDCDGNANNGCEASLNTSANCGACAAACFADCSGGVCPVCSCGGAGWGDCNNDCQTDGCETSLNTAASCGACGVVCTSGTCVDGVCQ